MYITRNRIQKLDCRTTWEINFSGPFSLWKRVRNWSCVSQNFQHLLWRSCADLVRILLMSNRPCCSPHLRFGVWNARSPKTKVSSLCDLLLSRSLDHLSVTESWLTSNDSITIANLTNSLEDDAVYHLPRSTRRGGGLAVIARKGRSWLLHPVNSLFVVISTFTSMTTQMQTLNNFLTFFFSADLSSPLQAH